MPMDARDKHHYEKARAVARELGLETIDADTSKEITPAEWRAWAQMAPTKRIAGFIAEGLVASRNASEIAEVKRKHMGGIRQGSKVSNDLAKDQVLQATAADLYSKLLRAIATEANKTDD